MGGLREPKAPIQEVFGQQFPAGESLREKSRTLRNNPRDQMQFQKIADPTSGIQLLKHAGLPTTDLPGPTTLYGGYQDSELVGIIGLESYGTAALLRSLVVSPTLRRSGIGISLVQELSNEARKEGISELWLLTETAPSFFSKLGFSTRNREDAPRGIKTSKEFSSLCPDTAVCMSLVLSP